MRLESPPSQEDVFPGGTRGEVGDPRAVRADARHQRHRRLFDRMLAIEIEQACRIPAARRSCHTRMAASQVGIGKFGGLGPFFLRSRREPPPRPESARLGRRERVFSGSCWKVRAVALGDLRAAGCAVAANHPMRARAAGRGSRLRGPTPADAARRAQRCSENAAIHRSDRGPAPGITRRARAIRGDPRAAASDPRLDAKYATQREAPRAVEKRCNEVQQVSQLSSCGTCRASALGDCVRAYARPRHGPIPRTGFLTSFSSCC